MKPRQKRLAIVVGGLAALGIAAALILNAFQSNLVFFFSPTDVAAGKAPQGKTFRIGGMVDYLVNRGIIAKTGAYLEFKGKKVHRGPLVEALRKADAYTELLQMLIDFEKANAEVE